MNLQHGHSLSRTHIQRAALISVNSTDGYGLLGKFSVLGVVELLNVRKRSTDPPHSPTPLPVLTVPGAQGAKAIS